MSTAPLKLESGEVGVVFSSCDTYRAHPRDFGRMLITRPFILYALVAALVVNAIDPGSFGAHRSAALGLALTGATFAVHGFLWWLQVVLIGVVTRRSDYPLAIPSILLQVLPAIALTMIGHLQIGVHVHPVDGLFHMPMFFYARFVLIAVIFELVAAYFVLPRGLNRLQAVRG